MIDDGRILGKSSEECWKNHNKVIEVFKKAGWNIQQTKTSTEPTQKLYHQGFLTDTVKMTYSLPQFKIEDLHNHLQSIISTAGEKIPRNFY